MSEQSSPADADADADADGADDAFDRFVRCTAHGAARRLGHASLRAGIDVQDLLQDTYIRALGVWQSTLAGLTEAQRQAWVVTTAGRRMVDLMRSPDYRHRKDIEVPDGATLEPHHDERIHARDRLRRVLTLIPNLSLREQEAVIRYSLLGDDYKTIAHDLGTSVGAVTTTMSRARAELAKMIAEEGLL